MQANLQGEISSIDTLIKNKKNSWTKIRLKGLEDKKATKIERLDEWKELANPTTPSAKQKGRQAVKRQAKAIQEIYRLKRRHLGADPVKKLDSEDEEFLAKSIEEKATLAWNRSKPRNKRSHQAKKFIGKGLFCTMKPPKTEDKQCQYTSSTCSR